MDKIKPRRILDRYKPQKDALHIASVVFNRKPDRLALSDKENIEAALKLVDVGQSLTGSHRRRHDAEYNPRSDARHIISKVFHRRNISAEAEAKLHGLLRKISAGYYLTKEVRHKLYTRNK